MAKAKLGETSLSVPITPEYRARLEKRADAHDRETSREAARIIKDVLDGRYVETTSAPVWIGSEQTQKGAASREDMGK